MQITKTVTLTNADTNYTLQALLEAAMGSDPRKVSHYCTYWRVEYHPSATGTFKGGDTTLSATNYGFILSAVGDGYSRDASGLNRLHLPSIAVRCDAAGKSLIVHVEYA